LAGVVARKLVSKGGKSDEASARPVAPAPDQQIVRLR
jgi:hypothetical protein